MKVHLDCIPCYVNQAVEASGFAAMDEDERWEAVQEVCRELSEVDRMKPSAQVGQKVHKIVRDHAESGDPYHEQKKSSNEKANEFFDEFREEVENSSDPLNTAARLAAAGNIVDFGPQRDFDVERTLREGLTEEFAINHWEEFSQHLKGAENILYFADNSGEIVFDKLFIEVLLRETGVEELDLVVKDGPFLNDVTVEDALKLNMDEIDGVKIRKVDNGDDGESPTLWSDEVEGWIDDFDLTISKGQANYEGLSGYSKRSLFFLLVVKCPLVEEEVGAEVGKKVLVNAHRRGHDQSR
ncbi:MAG: damage-control phosphatase ARMT1 family protein [Candidatus Acetothermia bacterium]